MGVVGGTGGKRRAREEGWNGGAELSPEEHVEMVGWRGGGEE